MKDITSKVLGLKVGDATEKLILLFLAVNSVDEPCFISVRNLSSECEITKSTTVKKIKNLREKGFINIERNTLDNGMIVENGYTVNLDGIN